MFTKLGFVSLLAGIVLAVFNALSQFTNKESFASGLTLESLLGDHAGTIAQAVPMAAVQDALGTLFYDTPLWGVLLGLGVFFLVAGTLMKGNS